MGCSNDSLLIIKKKDLIDLLSLMLKVFFSSVRLLFVYQGDTVYATVVPELDERELEKTINPIVQEYFEHGDTKEVEVSYSLTQSQITETLFQ